MTGIHWGLDGYSLIPSMYDPQGRMDKMPHYLLLFDVAKVCQDELVRDAEIIGRNRNLRHNRYLWTQQSLESYDPSRITAILPYHNSSMMSLSFGPIISYPSAFKCNPSGMIAVSTVPCLLIRSFPISLKITLVLV
jgi:hypothetical protein